MSRWEADRQKRLVPESLTTILLTRGASCKTTQSDLSQSLVSGRATVPSLLDSCAALPPPVANQRNRSTGGASGIFHPGSLCLRDLTDGLSLLRHVLAFALSPGAQTSSYDAYSFRGSSLWSWSSPVCGTPRLPHDSATDK